MHLTNDCYLVLIKTKTAIERYYRDDAGWLKISTRGRSFRLTAEQVLNHLLPALAGVKRHLAVEVQHRDFPSPPVKKVRLLQKAEARKRVIPVRPSGK